jgi:hypothetical protein
VYLSWAGAENFFPHLLIEYVDTGLRIGLFLREQMIVRDVGDDVLYYTLPGQAARSHGHTR